MASVEIARDTSSYIYGYSTDYATALSTGAGNAIGLGCGQRNFGASGWVIYRSCFRFDTSSLSGYTITKVNLKMSFATVTVANDFDVQIIKADWSAYSPITSGNKDAAYDIAGSASQDSSILRNTSGMAVSTLYTSGDLDTSWVNTGGYTYYALKSSREGTEPPGDEFVLTSTLPSTSNLKLLIEYTEGGGGSSTPIHLIRTGMQPGMRIGL